MVESKKLGLTERNRSTWRKISGHSEVSGTVNPCAKSELDKHISSMGSADPKVTDAEAARVLDVAKLAVALKKEDDGWDDYPSPRGPEVYG